ncbi:hypothetical protein AGIG_G19039 [Arapaima gigas]
MFKKTVSTYAAHQRPTNEGLVGLGPPGLAGFGRNRSRSPKINTRPKTVYNVPHETRIWHLSGSASAFRGNSEVMRERVTNTRRQAGNKSQRAAPEGNFQKRHTDAVDVLHVYPTTASLAAGFGRRCRWLSGESHRKVPNGQMVH